MLGHTLFLLQGKEVQLDTVDAIKEWSGSGLIHPVSFLDLDELTPESRIQEAEHFVLSEGTMSAQILLLDWLADNYCPVLRLVALHTAATRGEEEDGVRKAERLRAELLQWIGAEQKLLTLACFLVDPDEATLLTTSVLPTWSANLVVSPTDQALPAGTATPVRSRASNNIPNKRFAQLAAQNLCTLGAAWKFMGEGPLDSTSPHSQAAGVQVVRSFVRSLDLVDPTVSLTQSALQPTAEGYGQGWPVPAGSPAPVAAVPAASFAADAAQQVGDRHSAIIDLVELPPTAPRPVKELKLLEALRMFFEFLRRGIVSFPRNVVNTVVTAASNAASGLATNLIFGSSSAFTVRVGRPSMVPTADTEELQKALERAISIADPRNEFMPPITRDLWQEYVRVGISLVDGSDMPPTHRRPQIGDLQAVISDPSDVVVRPEYPNLTIPNTAVGGFTATVLSIEDPLQILLTQETLRARRIFLGGQEPEDAPGSATAESIEQSSPEAQAAGSPAENPQYPSRPDGTHQSAATTVAPITSAPTETPEGVDDEQELSREEIRIKEEQRLENLEEVEDQIVRIVEWVAKSGQPYTWQISSRLAESLSQAEMRFIAAANKLTEELPERPSEDPAKKKSMYRAVIAGIALFGFFMLLGLIHWLNWSLKVPSILPRVWASPLFTIGGISWWRSAPIAVGCLLIGTGISFSLFLKYLRKQFQLLHAYESGVDRQSEAARAFSYYAIQALRLNSVYWQCLRWTPMLATILHNPFAGRPTEPAAAKPTLIHDAPRATRSAAATPNRDKLEVMTHLARHQIFRVGWASVCWEASNMALLQNFQRQRALDDVTDPYEENFRRRSGILDYLQDGFSQGIHGPICREVPEGITRNLVTSSPIDSLTSNVLVDGNCLYPDAAAPSNADPANGLFNEILPEDDPGQFAANLWRKEGLGASVMVQQKVVTMVPGWGDSSRTDTRFIDSLHVQHDGQILFAAARVDLSEPCEASELAVFHTPVEQVEAVQQILPDDEGD